MTALKGTNVAASIVPFTDLDKYATHEAKYGKSGYRTINTIEEAFTIKKINFSNLDLYQLDTYSKYQEFTQEVIPSKPNDQDYKYRVAHTLLLDQ